MDSHKYALLIATCERYVSTCDELRRYDDSPTHGEMYTVLRNIRNTMRMELHELTA